MHGLIDATLDALSKGKQLLPAITTSTHYKHWISVEDLRRCIICKEMHGKIWSLTEIPVPSPPVHQNCRCAIEQMKAIIAGTATINATNGADWTIIHEGKLPYYYISVDDARKQGWKEGKQPSKYAPGKTITRGIFHNHNKHLPDKKGRVWYEADINYISGKRNAQRILWSNDGLIFVTFDHYQTFYEIEGGK